MLHISNSNEAEASRFLLTLVTQDIVDESLGQAGCRTFGIHMLDIPERVGIVLYQCWIGRVALNIYRGKVGTLCSAYTIAPAVWFISETTVAVLSLTRLAGP